jgi:hypothetical protein
MEPLRGENIKQKEDAPCLQLAHHFSCPTAGSLGGSKENNPKYIKIINDGT